MQQPSPGPGVHLVRTDERAAEVDALAAALGGRVGLGALLDDLRGTGAAVDAPSPRAARSTGPGPGTAPTAGTRGGGPRA